MQKTLPILLLLFSTYSAFSQINKGQFLIGGSGAFSSKDQNGIKSTSVTLSPNAGYFFLNKLAGGVDIGFYSGKTKWNLEKSTLSGYGISPFVRYYFLPASQKINLFAEASYGWGKGKSKYAANAPSATTASQSYSFSAGPVYFITPNIALELSAGYTGNTYKSKYENVYDNKSKETLFQMGIGFQIHLGNKRK